MRKSAKAAVVLVLVACLLVLVFWCIGGFQGQPRLMLTFIGFTNDVGVNLARFAVTNAGGAGAELSAVASVQLANPPTNIPASYRASVGALPPRSAGVLEVVLPPLFTPRKPDQTLDLFKPPVFQGKWRVTCLYAASGLRAASYHFIWDRRGGGILRSYIPIRLVPRYFKQLPLDGEATCDWLGN